VIRQKVTAQFFSFFQCYQCFICCHFTLAILAASATNDSLA
jgi:hypothetical protein